MFCSSFGGALVLFAVEGGGRAWLVGGVKRLRLNDATAGDWLIFRAVIPDQILISNMVPFKDNYDTVAGRWHLAGGPTDVLLAI